jgi:hypothetical protein
MKNIVNILKSELNYYKYCNMVLIGLPFGYSIYTLISHAVFKYSFHSEMIAAGITGYGIIIAAGIKIIAGLINSRDHLYQMLPLSHKIIALARILCEIFPFIVILLYRLPFYLFKLNNSNGDLALSFNLMAIFLFVIGVLLIRDLLNLISYNLHKVIVVIICLIGSYVILGCSMGFVLFLNRPSFFNFNYFLGFIFFSQLIFSGSLLLIIDYFIYLKRKSHLK